MAQDQEPTASGPAPGTTINVNIPGKGIIGFPDMASAKAAAKRAVEEGHGLQVQGSGFSIGDALKKLLTPEAAGLAGFAAAGPVGAGLAAGGTSLARNLAKGEPLDPIAAGEHVALNAIPGAAASAYERVPAALAKASGTNTGGSLMRALGEILGGGEAPAVDTLRVKGNLASNGQPLVSDATKAGLIQKWADAENAIPSLKAGAKADMIRRSRQLTAAIDGLGNVFTGRAATLSPEVEGILKANGLNPQTIRDLWAQRLAGGAHGAMAIGAGQIEGAR